MYCHQISASRICTYRYFLPNCYLASDRNHDNLSPRTLLTLCFSPQTIWSGSSSLWILLAFVWILWYFRYRLVTCWYLWLAGSRNGLYITSVRNSTRSVCTAVVVLCSWLVWISLVLLMLFQLCCPYCRRIRTKISEWSRVWNKFRGIRFVLWVI